MLDLPILAKDRTIAGPGFNRWLVAPAALAIHLCIGMSYGFSVFWLPLSNAIGIKQAVACAKDMGFFDQLFATGCDWQVSALTWTFRLFFVGLGFAAALWGGWLEHAGPRKAGVVAAVCWAGGLAIASLGVYIHQILLLWLGAGLIGGIGLGLGYISPVSTLIKWFPDRRGMATGMAIMGFGGGALVGAPLAVYLMGYFKTASSVGVWETLLVLAVIYFIFMLGGAFGYRVPPTGWQPAGWVPPVKQSANAMITKRHVHLNTAMKTPQFWLIWAVLMLNVSAGIGVISMASPMMQEMFGGQLVGLKTTLDQLSAVDKKTVVAIAGGFTALIALFNSGGRFVWASVSDFIGRKATYVVFFVLGLILFAALPGFGHSGNLGLFVASVCIILSMYGGGFATVPAYLADMFGTQMVGAIHGRLLTAWSVAALVGPEVISSLRDSQIASGMPKALVYDQPMYIMAGLLAVGLVCNLLIRPVDEKYFMSEAELEKEKQLAHERDMANATTAATTVKEGDTASSNVLVVVLCWAVVIIPMAWGAWISLQKAAIFFK